MMMACTSVLSPHELVQNRSCPEGPHFCSFINRLLCAFKGSVGCFHRAFEVDSPRALVLSRCTRRAASRRSLKTPGTAWAVLWSFPCNCCERRSMIELRMPVPWVCNLECSPLHPSRVPWCQTRIGHDTDDDHVGTTIHGAGDGSI